MTNVKSKSLTETSADKKENTYHSAFLDSRMEKDFEKLNLDIKSNRLNTEEFSKNNLSNTPANSNSTNTQNINYIGSII